MKVTVERQPVISSYLKVESFANQLSKTLNLEKAFKKNFVIEKNESEIEDEQIAEYVFNGVDWGDIIGNINEIAEENLKILLYVAHIEGVTVYDPDTIDLENGMFILKDKKIDKHDFLMVHVNNPRIDKHIEFMIGGDLIDYGTIDWKILIDLDKYMGE